MNRIDQANQYAVERINKANPLLVGVKYASEVIPQLDNRTIGHAGPPLLWHKMCGPMQGAVLGAALYEGMAPTLDEARLKIERGRIKLVSNHSIGCVGPMTGMITRSMPLWVVKNETFGNYAYSPFNEGLGKVMRFGANGPEVIKRLKWMEKILAPVLQAALRISGPISLKVIIAKALTMGDEMHQRNVAASALLFSKLAPYLAKIANNQAELYEVLDFISGNVQFFLNVAMAAGKATMDPVSNISHCSIVTAMSRNGTNFGIKVSALGDTWFEAPVLMPKGLFFPGYSKEDANPDMGDSAIVETFGIGGFAMGAAPAVVRFLGGESVQEAYDYSREMMEITAGVSNEYLITTLDFAGTATGIDIRKVVETGILPVINTGIAHKNPGVGQVGAGIVTAPMKCFVDAIYAFAEQEGISQ